MPRRIAVIQARVLSSRLPGKVLMPLLGIPTILFMIERIRRAELLDDVIVATSTDSSDDPLVRLVASSGTRCYRGSLYDVLDRFHGAAAMSSADHLVRLTADCPLMDADLIDKALVLLDAGQLDYVSNVDPPTFPDGLDVEAFTREALETAHTLATSAWEREHVTPFLRKRTDLFKSRCWRSMTDLSALRWTVDYQDDLDSIRGMLARLHNPTPTSFDRFDLYRVCEREAALLAKPRHHRNEGSGLTYVGRRAAGSE